MQQGGVLEVWLATGIEPPRIDRNARYLAHNIRVTLGLPYIMHYLDRAELDPLDHALTVIENDVLPVLADQNHIRTAQQRMQSLRDDLFRVSAAAVSRMSLVSETTHNQALFQRFTFFAAIGLSAIIFMAALVVWRYRFTRWKNVHMRSFASLFAHMARTRVAALRLFLERLNDNPGTSPEMVKHARRTVNELVSINDRLASIAFSGSDTRGKRGVTRRKLTDLLEEIVAHHAPHVRLDADLSAWKALVPASEFMVVVDELVGNAKKAVATRSKPEIRIRARVRRPFSAASCFWTSSTTVSE